MANMAIHIDSDGQCDADQDGDVEGAHDLTKRLPVLAEKVASGGQTQGPEEGADKGEKDELSQVHTSYARRKADEATGYGDEPGEKNRPCAILFKPAVRHAEVSVSNEHISPVPLQKCPPAPGPDGVDDERTDEASHSTVESGQEEIPWA